MQVNPDEIEQLLQKIDEDTERIKYLETMIDFEQSSKRGLEQRLQTLEEQKSKSSYQQSRMLRERDNVVREMSVEIDTISARLKASTKERTNWKQKYAKLEQMYEELEGDFFKLKSKCEEQTKHLEKKEQELRQIHEVVGMYDDLKRDIQMKEKSKEHEKNLISFKAREISDYYQKLKADLINDQNKLKKMLIKSSRIPLDMSNSKSNKEESSLLKQRLVMLGKENLLLKKELMKILKHMMKQEKYEKEESNKNYKKAEKNQKDVEIVRQTNKEEANLKGSILSFSNNMFTDNSFVKESSKKKIISPDKRRPSLNQDKLQGSHVINIRKFQAFKPENPTYPKSLHVSQNKSILMFFTLKINRRFFFQ